MSASNKDSKTKAKSEIVNEFDGDVLFQKIYDKWYAFSMVDNECLMTEVPKEHIDRFQSKVSKK